MRSVGPLPHGHSGFTYEVRASGPGGEQELVLRLPPPGARPLGPADVDRQGRIVAALGALGLPVPALLARSAEPVVDGRPYVLFERVRGMRVEEVERRLSGELLVASAVQTLRRLHAVPAGRSGLAGEEPVLPAAEVERWRLLHQRARAELDLPYEALREALLATLPEPSDPPRLVHADFHCGNLLFDEAGRVVAILDWEIAEIGQPLLDLACLSVAGLSRDAADGGPVPGPRVPPDRLAALYGADPQEFRWYCALTCYKYAAVYVYNLMLHLRGKRVDPHNEGLEPYIARLLQSGLTLLGA